MKRTLPFYIALGVAFSGAQPVLANTAGLNFYGRAHVSTDFLDNGDDSDLNVSSNSSRIGVRASTDLGEGLKGILQVETQINYDNGSGSLANRDTFVGLEGGFGRVRFGQIDTPLKQIRSTVDVFGDQIGDLRNLTRLNGSTGAPFTGQDFDARFKNGVYYNTPSLNGFVFNFHYTPEVKEATNLDDDSAAYSTSLAYDAGNLYLAIAHEQWESVDDSSAIRLGARYKICLRTKMFKSLALARLTNSPPNGRQKARCTTWMQKIGMTAVQLSLRLAPTIFSATNSAFCLPMHKQITRMLQLTGSPAAVDTATPLQP
jgi:predicted porin